MRTKTGEIKVGSSSISVKGDGVEVEVSVSPNQLMSLLDVLEGRRAGIRIGRGKEGKKHLIEVFRPQDGGVVVVGKVFEGDTLKGKKSFRLRSGAFVLSAEVKGALRSAMEEGKEIRRFVSPLYYSLGGRGLYLLYKEKEAFVPRSACGALLEALKQRGELEVGKVKVQGEKLYVGDKEVEEHAKAEIQRLLELCS